MAFIPMYFMGITANIMSLAGIAISIGALTDEAVVMVENVHKRLEHAPPGLSSAQRREIVISACKQLGKPLFFALLVITVSFLPVFTLEAQEGRMFKPLAYTKTFTMGCAAFLSVTLGPALIVLMTGLKVIPEHRHPISRALHRLYYPWVSALMRRRVLSITIAVAAVVSSFPIYKKLGYEFIPPLNEGTILYMPTTLPTISITEATRLMQIQDRVLKSFPEVASVHGKAGRSETATDPAPLEMFETVVQLKPEKEWRAVPKPRWYSSWAPDWAKAGLRKIWPDTRPVHWDELVSQMDEALTIPGLVNAWTMPIRARIDMLSTGIRTPVGIKIFGADLNQINTLGEKIEAALRMVPGTRSAFAERTVGGLYLDIVPRRTEIARYGFNVEDVLAQVETAIGGMAIDRTVEGRERYSINVRYARELRDDVEKLKRVLVPMGVGMSAPAAGESMNQGGGGRAQAGAVARQVPFGQLADIHITSGPPMIKNEDGALTGWVYVDVEGSDIGGYVERAQRAVREQIEEAGLLPSGYRLEWTGQYEYMVRAMERLKIVVPLTLLLIFLLLYVNFKSIAETFIILLSIPFAMTGSIWMLWLLDYHLSVAVWVGIIALAGLAAQTGTIMIIYLDEAFHAYQKAGRMNTQHDLFEAITYGAVQRVRPKLMTLAMITLGLVPAMWAGGAGAEAIQRIAAPMVGGLVTSTILTLEIVPAIYSIWRGCQVQWVKGPKPPKKSWNELSEQFTAWEREQHASLFESAPGAGTSAASDAFAAEKPRRKTWVLWAIGLLVAVAIFAVWFAKKPADAPPPDPAAQQPELENPKPAPALPPIDLAAPQAESVAKLVTVADAISAALAADSLQGYNEAAGKLSAAVGEAVGSLDAGHPWASPLTALREQSELQPAADLATARKDFLPFSTAFVDFAGALRQQAAAFNSLKIYRCPMAPGKGVWIQLKGPLRNPYYGEEMLECGVEVK